MKLGMIGLIGSGRTTLFEALTRNVAPHKQADLDRSHTIHVPDHRLEKLTALYHPQKTIYAQVEYFLPGRSGLPADQEKLQQPLMRVRDCDALIHVIRNFKSYGIEPPTPLADFKQLEQELILSDLVVVEKRLERLAQDRQRHRNVNPDELKLIEQCHAMLEKEMPVRDDEALASDPLLRGFALLSAKPMLLLFNNADDDDTIPNAQAFPENLEQIALKGKIEQELSQMSAAEAEEFLKEFGITASAMDRVIKESYALLGLVSFFTVGEDEVRAWTIRDNTPAVEAAGVIHSDIQRGFIRAEVVSYDHLMASGNYVEARKKGQVRLEGKTYQVQDGDIINFRFNV